MGIWIDGAWIPSLFMALLIGIIICIILIVKRDTEYLDCELVMGFSIFIITIILANFVFLERHKYVNREIKKINLLSLKTISSIEGNMFLISSGEQYSGLVKTKKGFKKFFISGNSEIIPDDKSFYLKTCDVEYIQFYIPYIYDGKWKENDKLMYSNCKEYIHIPKGSIKFEFKVD